MSKWTDWIPHTGDECPVDGDEKMKIRFEDDKPGDYVCVNQPTMLNWISPCRHPHITHFKRLKKNVAAEKLDAEIDAFMEDDPEPPEPATPIITGPGEYKTAGGEKAVVSELGSNTPWPVFGHVGPFGVVWNQWGRSASFGPDYTIIGPWTEDTADIADTKAEEPEMWVNVFEYRDGSRECTDPVPTKSEALICNVRGTAPIGTYKLVKEE